MDDLQLEYIRRVKRDKNDFEAWDYLYLNYKNYLLKIISRYIYDPHLQEDVLQDTWIKVFRNIDKYYETNKFTIWLLVIASNICKSWLKKNIRINQAGENLIQTTDDLEIYMGSVKEGIFQGGFDDEFCIKELIEAALNTIEKERERLAFKYRYYDNLSQKEIAKLLNEKESVTKNWVFRTRDKVTQYMRESMDLKSIDKDEKKTEIQK